MAGSNTGEIVNCSSSCSVAGISVLGGIAGYSSGTIERCYSAGAVTGTGSSQVGGIAGQLEGKPAAVIKDCYATGIISGITSLGGIAGECKQASILNCYASGDVLSDGMAVDIIGGIAGEATSTVIENCVSLSNYVTGAGNTGCITGDTRATIINCYARDGTSAVGAENSINGMGITSAQWGDSAWWRDEAFFTDSWWEGKLPLSLG